MSESKLAEVVAPRLIALDAAGANPTIAFLASGMEGIKVRITAKASTEALARTMLDDEEAELRALLGESVFGVDEETMEHAVGSLLQARGLTLGLAESVTGGLVASRLVSIPGASAWLRGSVVAYDTAVKRELLGVGDAPAVSEQTAQEMAAGACRVLGSDLGLAITGVAGPTTQDGVPIGTVWCGLAGPGPSLDAVRMQLPGDRERIRQFAAISALDVLRRRMMEPAPA